MLQWIDLFRFSFPSLFFFTIFRWVGSRDMLSILLALATAVVIVGLVVLVCSGRTMNETRWVSFNRVINRRTTEFDDRKRNQNVLFKEVKQNGKNKKNYE